MPEKLPIMSVKSDSKDFYKPVVKGSTKIFEPGSLPETRRRVAAQIDEVKAAFASRFAESPGVPAVAKVKLIDAALAKSHRPAALLINSDCPVITVNKFGELLTTVTPQSLTSLQRAVNNDNRQVIMANISTIEKIEAFSLDDAVPFGLQNLEMAIELGFNELKYKLFKHEDLALERLLMQAFFKKINELGLESPEEIHYATGLKIFSLKGVGINDAKKLATFVGTQSLSLFPTYQAVRRASEFVRATAANEFAGPTPGHNYPLLGIIDSGVDPSDNVLAPWIHDRSSFVHASEVDHTHGSFVAGLTIYGKQLNHDDERFPVTQAKIVDVVALPKSGIPVTEKEILQKITEALDNHPEVKIWNLSLATQNPCLDNAFSDFGMALDELADDYDVQFVIAAGNYEDRPLRGWPAKNLGQSDRICGPADSVRGLTVGSLAHAERANSLVKIDEPSPFSRKGPGPMYHPKPELSHYGGNFSKTGQFAQLGLLSFDGRGNIAEDIGTSFSCPIVSSIVTHVRAGLLKPTRNLVNALTIQSALLNSQQSTPEEFPYRGFGIPSTVENVLSCGQNRCTLVFDVNLKPGMIYHKDDFPIPPCMRDAKGKVIGEFVVTLVYDPPLDANAGSEYCRTNVDVSLGTYKIDPKTGKRKHNQEIPIESGDTHSREKTLVEHGFKWSPVKVYRRKVTRGISGDMWRLKMTMLNRSGFAPDNQEQNVALVITLIGPKENSPVYDEMVRLMSRNGWEVENLKVEERYRLGNRPDGQRRNDD